ncbi:Sel1 repeat Probable secreted protein, partial [Salmonella enterica subsp. enterica serovar Manhattan str. CFSAN001078]
MIKRKWSILFLLGLSFASVCQAGDDIDALYSRIAQKDIQALNELKALAKDNNAQALAELGFIYEYGVSVSVDIPQAIKYYEQACDLDGDYGCFNAAYFYEYGIGTQKDITQAKTLAKQLREKINLSNINLDKKVSERIIGSVYSNKLEAYRDLSFRPHFIQGLSFYFYAPQSDERKLLSRIGFDSSHLARIAILWAREGDPEVAYQTAKLVSTLYFNNETKTIDIAEALKWLRISAEKGDADSQTLLGFLYEHAGLGLQPDGEKARKWYEMAAQQGNGEALYTLGRMYYSGVMVNVDYDKALYFFKKAYEKELQAAADYLAQMYF